MTAHPLFLSSSVTVDINDQLDFLFCQNEYSEPECVCHELILLDLR